MCLREVFYNVEGGFVHVFLFVKLCAQLLRTGVRDDPDSVSKELQKTKKFSKNGNTYF